MLLDEQIMLEKSEVVSLYIIVLRSLTSSAASVRCCNVKLPTAIPGRYRETPGSTGESLITIPD